MSKKHKKKYPIHDGYYQQVLGKDCCCYNDLLDAVDQKLRETILGRISFIIRTLNPESLSLDVRDKNFDIDGYELNSITRKDETIWFDIVFDGDKEAFSEITYNLDDIVHVCYELEREYVSKGSRFISEDPYGKDYETEEVESEEFDEQREFLANEITGFLADLRDAFDDGCGPNEIARIILSEAAGLIALSDNPKEALDLFVEDAKMLRASVSEKVQDEKTSKFLS